MFEISKYYVSLYWRTPYWCILHCISALTHQYGALLFHQKKQPYHRMKSKISLTI